MCSLGFPASFFKKVFSTLPRLSMPGVVTACETLPWASAFSASVFPLLCSSGSFDQQGPWVSWIYWVTHLMSGYHELADRRGYSKTTRPNTALEKLQDCTNFLLGAVAWKSPCLSLSSMLTLERRWWEQIGRERTDLQTNLSLKHTSQKSKSFLWGAKPRRYLNAPVGSLEETKRWQVLMMFLWEQLAVKMPGKLRYTWWSKRHGFESLQSEESLKDWSGLEIATDLNFPFYYLQRIYFSRRKRRKTTSFTWVAREDDSVKDNISLFFSSQREVFLVNFSFERCTI